MGAADVLKLMRERGRDLYVAGDGHGWFLTYGGGHVPTVVVGEVLATGLLCRRFSGLPGYYCLGDLTIDREKMYATPPKERKHSPMIYLAEPERDLTLAEALKRPVPA
jgi:hypothetical protein